MRSTEPMRLACPACLGVALEKVSAAPGVEIDHCRRCGGTWILREQTARLRAVPASALRATITRSQDAAFVCHACHVPMERDAAFCPWCKWKNALECPECGKAMSRRSERGTAVDVCRGCRAVWLDHHELASIWAVAAAGAVAHYGAAGQMNPALDAGSFLLDALWYAPDLVAHTAYYGAQAGAHVVGAAAEAAAHAPGLLASTPELVAGAAEVAGEAAGGVFSFIAEIIAGIFGGLG
ncbi:MAG TPA: zf-TFIIB domain-containing protein [Longimicrobium sp.]|uniref:TFIIB-type zinc ribbon-containing protein n=1 Tax=Longimicrobium sp. TaxID=2029185 RepID=UPI002EDAFB35